MDKLKHDHATGKFRSGDTQIFFRLFGKPGRMPIVIVHGLSYFSYDWIEPAQELAGDRHIAAMDMRGFGESDWAKDYSVSANSADIIGLIDHLKWPKVVLVGHSMGGRQCTYCAAKNPARVAGLILVDWSPENAPAGTRRVTEIVGRTPAKFATVDDAMTYFGADPHSPRGAAKRARFEAYLKPVSGGFAVKRDTHFRDQFKRVLETGERAKLGVDMWAVLSEVTCPMLVIRGRGSDMFAAETAIKMKACNPRASIVEVDAGHDVAGENLEGFLRETRAFLASQGE
jgi:esterase